MLLQWMAYTTLLGIIAFAAGIVAERIAATWNFAHRPVWLAAIVLSTLVPALLSARSDAHIMPNSASAPTSDTSFDVDVSLTAPAMRRTSVWATMRSSAEQAVTTADPYVLRAWFVLSLGYLAILLRSAVGVRRQRMRWLAAELDGMYVLVAANTGPAVVGILSPRVVIPQWALGLDAPARRLMLLHEVEHVRARDPLVLFVAAIATVLFPWNAALWLLVQRLRLAIEIDCDRRVLAATSARHEYGLLLLTVGARRSASLPFAASLAERRPLLERRIKAMTKPTPKHPRLISLTGVVVLVVAATAAMRTPRPKSLVILGERPLQAMMELPSRVATTPTLTDSAPRAVLMAPVKAQSPQVKKVSRPKVAPATVTAISGAPDSLILEEIRGMIAAHHPSALTGDPNANTITLVVDARMRYVVSMAESRELRPYLLEMPRGRGRSGGAGPGGLAGGSSPGARARGSIDGNNTPPDSATLARLAVLKARMVENPAVRGDTMIIVDDVFMHRGPNAGERSPEPTAEDLKRLGDMLGMNVPALAALIGLGNVESIRGRTYRAGELGTTTLRVFVVRMMP